MNFFVRLYGIIAIIYRYALLDLLSALSLPGPLSWVIRMIPQGKTYESMPLPQRLRLSLEELGPIYVKFGQFLSTRPDILPAPYIVELSRLQDRVAPFPNEVALEIIETNLGHPVSDLFYEFAEGPVASASIAQVYQAYLKTEDGKRGQKVAVKVIRPQIEKLINQDLNVLDKICRALELISHDAKRLKLTEVLHEFAKHLHDEVNLLNEASNGSLLRRQFLHSTMLLVPEIYFDYSTKEVLTLEWMDGTAVTDIAKLKEQGIDLIQLSEFGVNIFFTQVFKNGFFHADMHPGNILVAPDGRYIALDFGIVGSLTEFDKRYLALNFLAFFNRDYYRVAEIHIESGWVPANTRIEEFEAAIRYVCEPIFNQPLVKISFGLVLLRLFEVSRRFNIEIQPQLVLLQKTLLNVEGLGRQLNPNLDLWAIGKPFFEEWKSEQFGLKALAHNIKKESLNWSRILPRLPTQLYTYLNHNDGENKRLEALFITQKKINFWLRALFFLFLILFLYRLFFS